MRLILIRHGETEHNRHRLTLGRADMPLNELGRAQARAAARSFVRPPDAIYTSPLARTMDTADAIGLATGVPVTVEPDLIEMDVGDMEHLTGAELRERYPDFLRQWMSGEAAEADARMPGGETLREVQARAWSVAERLQAAHSDGEIVAVTHNFVILTLVCRALNLPLAEFRRLRQGLGARTVIEMADGRATLIQLNDDSHIRAAGLVPDRAP